MDGRSGGRGGEGNDFGLDVTLLSCIRYSVLLICPFPPHFTCSTLLEASGQMAKADGSVVATRAVRSPDTVQ